MTGLGGLQAGESWKSEDGRIVVRHLEEAGHDGKPQFDELFLEGVKSVHLEMMSDSHLWGRFEMTDGRALRFAFFAKSERTRLQGFVEPD